jgi:hypothetical protein
MQPCVCFKLVLIPSLGKNERTKELTTRVVFGVLLWIPAVIRSNFSFKLPSHGCRLTGIKFWRKSPAVGSMKRHCPLEATRETEEKARVAVLSRWFDSAAEEGWRVPPAPETGTGVVGLAASVARIISPPVTAAAEDRTAAETEETSTALLDGGAEERIKELLAAALVTKTVVMEIHWEAAWETACATSEVDATRAAVDEVEDVERAVIVAETAAAPPPLKVNDWLASAALQGASSRILAEVTVKHVPTAFVGSSANGPAPPENVNSWEFVTVPPTKVRLGDPSYVKILPPSALPPQENMITVSPAALRGSKLRQAWVWEMSALINDVWESSIPKCSQQA